MKPDTNQAGATGQRWSEVKRKFRKILYWAGFLIILILAGFIYWKYFFTYSEGYRAGLLQKFSSKGTLFKTYEGELILSSVAGGSNVVIASEKFLFSVTDKTLAPALDTLQGRSVIVHYKQKKGTLIWRGDSPYLVDSVRRR
ncbi:MAG TPA: hypothetical protein VJ203_10370 [Bacteroidales bacterium]|nr:hypothetical protein [Bacteroidales bacterium]